jgi:uncharacterized protein
VVRRGAATKMGAVPIRTCSGCRARRMQSDLIRVAVQTDGGIVTRREGVAPRLPGRGAYVCPRASCVEAAWARGGLKRALKYQGALPATLHEELVRAAAEKG